ncbi:hypothetical protein S83_033318 [Arachis hypogaea]
MRIIPPLHHYSAVSNGDCYESDSSSFAPPLAIQRLEIAKSDLQHRITKERQCFGRMYLVQDSRQQKNVLGSSRKLGQTGQSSNSNDVNVGNKKHAPMKKQTPVNIQPQDTSIERPIWEVTSEKFWHHPV